MISFSANDRVPGRRWPVVIAAAWALFLLAACASVEPLLDFDLAMFRGRVDDVLKTGMTLREAKKTILSALPNPVMTSEIAPVVRSGKMQVENRRYMIGWTTTTPEKNLTLTLFFDHDGRLARWTVGPVYGRM